MLIDSHAHLNFEQFKKDREDLIKKCLADDIWMINVGSQLSTSKRAIEIAEQYKKGVYAVVGLHPIHLENQVYEDVIDGEKIEFKTRAEDLDVNKYKELAEHEKVVGIGETGFDFYHIQSKNKQEIIKMQSQALEEHLDLARQVDKAVALHCRDAYDEMIDFLNNHNQVQGVLHCYGGNLDQVKQFLDLGLYIGFTGIVTFNNAKSVQEAAKYVPLDRLLIETDCPYLAPEPHRGERNQPDYVQFIAAKIAELKGISVEEVSEATWQNTKKLFKI